MNMLPNEAMDFITRLSEVIRGVKSEIVLCVPYTDLFYALLTAQGTNIKIGAQNMHFEEKWSIHRRSVSKNAKINKRRICNNRALRRRQYFNETDETVNKK